MLIADSVGMRGRLSNLVHETLFAPSAQVAPAGRCDRLDPRLVTSHERVCPHFATSFSRRAASGFTPIQLGPSTGLLLNAGSFKNCCLRVAYGLLTHTFRLLLLDEPPFHRSRCGAHRQSLQQSLLALLASTLYSSASSRESL